jgi:hypothetical protein
MGSAVLGIDMDTDTAVLFFLAIYKKWIISLGTCLEGQNTWW